jgi:mono/diheme cytochrome c family protein
MRLAIRLFSLNFALCTLNCLAGCQQKMAEQPAPRTYEPVQSIPKTGATDTVQYVSSSLLLEEGTVHRGQRPGSDPLVSGLTAKGRNPRPAYAPEYLSKLPADKAKLLEDARVAVGAPDALDNFVDAFPWKITEEDLLIGQQKYAIECAICHGAAGNGKGKIAERGTLWPPSYHRDPAGKEMDAYGSVGNDGLARGHSRGFHRFGITVALDEVPVGYIFEVVSRGYGSMPYLRDKISAEDRWRIVAYLRALQLSQGAKLADLPAATKAEVERKLAGPSKPAEPKTGGH